MGHRMEANCLWQNLAAQEAQDHDRTIRCDLRRRRRSELTIIARAKHNRIPTG